MTAVRMPGGSTGRGIPTAWTGEAPLIEPEEWVQDALCAQVDSEIFFPPESGSANEARAVCARCDVRERCLEYALRTRQRHGVWGGFTTRERDLLRSDE